MCSIFYIFSYFFTGTFFHRQTLVADTRPRVAARLTLSGRLQPAGDRTCARQLGAGLTPSGTKLDRNGVPKQGARDIGKKDMFQTRIV